MVICSYGASPGMVQLHCLNSTGFFTGLSFHTELGGLLKYVRPFLNSISKAKAARLVRSLLDLFLDMEAATGQEVRQLEFSNRPAAYKSRVVSQVV